MSETQVQTTDPNEEPTTPTPAPAPDTEQVVEAKLRLEGRLNSGANWFHWIAALSVLNSAIIFFGGTWSFIVGLGVTMVSDAIMFSLADGNPAVGTLARILGLAFTLLVASFFVMLGVQARRRKRWAFIVGMVFYAIDGILMLLFQDFLSAGFHAWVLFGLAGGLKALGQMPKDTLSGQDLGEPVKE